MVGCKVHGARCKVHGAPPCGLYLQPVGGDVLVEQREHVRLVAQQHIGAARSRAQPADAGAGAQLEHPLAAQRSTLLLQQRRHLSAAVPDPCACRVAVERSEPKPSPALALHWQLGLRLTLG